MAAPQVAGLAALLFAVDPNLTNSDVRSIIETTADDLGASGFDKFFGNGRINAHAAVLAVRWETVNHRTTTGSTSLIPIHEPEGGDPITLDGERVSR